MAESEKKAEGQQTPPAAAPTESTSVVSHTQVPSEGGSAAAAESTQPSKKDGNGGMLILALVIGALAIGLTYVAYQQHKNPKWSFKAEMEKWKHERKRESDEPATTDE